MGRTREEIMAALPKARRARVDARTVELAGEDVSAILMAGAK
jgi:hypothetical protein